MVFINLLYLLFLFLQASAKPLAEPGAEPQQFTNNAPFSGAIYLSIPNCNGPQCALPDGGLTNYCPNNAPVSCKSVEQPQWCCPQNYTCVCPNPTGSVPVVGCCPPGATCNGDFPSKAASTVTVTALLVPPTPAPVQETTHQVASPSICRTLVMDGLKSTITHPARCGNLASEGYGLAVIIPLHPSQAAKVVFGYGTVVVATLMSFVVVKMFGYGLLLRD